MNRRATVKYRLEMKNLRLKDLSNHLGISPDGLYKKLNGDLSIKESEKEAISKFLELSKFESDVLWS